MITPHIFYFGPWDVSGHYLHDQSHRTIWPDNDRIGPWRVGELDGGLCPNVSTEASWKRTGPEIEGDALLHHKVRRGGTVYVSSLPSALTSLPATAAFLRL